MSPNTDRNVVTPGPWREGRMGGSIVAGTPIGIPFDSPEDVLAYGGFLVCESVQTGNARLITAAPDMLALLRRVECFCPVDVQDEIRAVVRFVTNNEEASNATR